MPNYITFELAMNSLLVTHTHTHIHTHTHTHIHTHTHTHTHMLTHTTHAWHEGSNAFENSY